MYGMSDTDRPRTPKPPKPSRESIYDTQINPLMAQIIALCKEHDIPIVASFQYDDRQTPGAADFCTTVILPPDASDRLKLAEAMIMHGVAALIARRR